MRIEPDLRDLVNPVRPVGFAFTLIVYDDRRSRFQLPDTRLPKPADTEIDPHNSETAWIPIPFSPAWRSHHRSHSARLRRCWLYSSVRRFPARSAPDWLRQDGLRPPGPVRPYGILLHCLSRLEPGWASPRKFPRRLCR